MTGYNMDFLIAGLILLLLVMYHFEGQKKLDGVSTRIFRNFILVGIADVALDLLCTILIGGDIRSLAELTKLLLTVLYLLQLLFPFSVILYAQSLRNISYSQLKKAMVPWVVIPLIMCVAVILNYWTGMFFSFDANGVYHRGNAYMFMYYYAILCTVGVGIIIIVHYRELGQKRAKILWEFLLIEAICIAVQAMKGYYLTTGFGIAVGITILYITLSNPAASTDQLTGLFGKTRLDQWYREQKETGKRIHVLAVEAKDMKYVNKVFGSTAGDQILVEIAEVLEEFSGSVRAFRISGKRFLLAMETLAEYEACRTRLQDFFQNRFRVNGTEIAFPVIIIGVINADTMDEDTLISYLEYITGLVPEEEENTVLIQSDEQLMEGFLYEQEVERFLGTALDRDLFEVYYQPIYSIREKRFVTMEALSRLYHPTLGYIPPDVFITLAEKNGQIARIGQLQFGRICRFLKENEEILQKVSHVKFNLSPREILQYGYTESLIDIIREYDLDPACFQFEITETVATEYSDTLYMTVKKLLDAGIGLCLDDFGSGYANLNTVLKLPFSAIKLDRSLLDGAVGDGQGARFYQGVVSMFRELGYQIISEGAETEEETELLKSLGVDLIQGYYYSRPVSEKEICKKLSGIG